MKDNENLLNYKKFIDFDNLINFMSLKIKIGPGGTRTRNVRMQNGNFPKY